MKPGGSEQCLQWKRASAHKHRLYTSSTASSHIISNSKQRLERQFGIRTEILQAGPSPELPPISMPAMLEAEVAAAAAVPVTDDAMSMVIDVMVDELMIRYYEKSSRKQ